MTGIVVDDPEGVIVSIGLEQACAGATTRCTPALGRPGCENTVVFPHGVGTCVLRVKLSNGEERVFTKEVLAHPNCGDEIVYQPDDPDVHVSLGDAGPDATGDASVDDGVVDTAADLSAEDGVSDGVDASDALGG